DERLLELLGDRGAVEALEHAARDLARAKALHARAPREVAVRALEGAAHAPRGHRHLQAAGDGPLLAGLDPDLGALCAHRLRSRGSLGARSETRTRTSRGTQDPKSCASASSAIRAKGRG